VDRGGIGEPERQIRQVVSQDFLDFAAQDFALGRIHFDSNLIRQDINARIAIMSAVRPVRRKSLGAEDKLENVGIVVRADPTQ
jgi:hypothetical protein